MYGKLPKDLGIVLVDSKEMLFYQYLPIKLAGASQIKIEERLTSYNNLIGKCACDFIADYGLSRYTHSYVYLTVKRLFVSPGANMNREGWHADGFMTDDINYIWSDCLPTVFNSSSFKISQSDQLSLAEMQAQALPENNVSYANKSLLRLNQYNIHRCAEIESPTVRSFAKISFSYDKYDLEGNSHNYLLDYNWSMRPRKQERNVPQELK